MAKTSKFQWEAGPFLELMRLTGTVFALCVVCALLLGLTNIATKDRIDQAAQDKKNAAMTAVLPADSYEPVAYIGEDPTISEAYRAGDGGYVFLIEPAGSFGGGLKMMVGVDGGGTVSGVEIMESAETPDLGDNARKPAFLHQFVGKSGGVRVARDGGSIDALAGATITSRAVCAGVSSALAAAAGLD